MFGYIVVNKPELKTKELDCYHSYYCGLCKELQKRHGLFGRIGISYDMSFLWMLLTGLYEPETTEKKENCILHPFAKKSCTTNEIAEYAADMNVLLMYHKCMDDWHDEKDHSGAVYGKLLEKNMKVLRGKYPDKCAEIANVIKDMDDLEENLEEDIDKMASYSGRLLGTVFAYQKDEWEDELYTMGFYLGKFIYLCDAYEDLYEDIKKGYYNPFHAIYQEDSFEDQCKEMMTMMMAECCRAFEMLPIIENASILKNVLYSGVWCRYEKIHGERVARKGGGR